MSTRARTCHCGGTTRAELRRRSGATHSLHLAQLRRHRVREELREAHLLPKPVQRLTIRNLDLQIDLEDSEGELHRLHCIDAVRCRKVTEPSQTTRALPRVVSLGRLTKPKRDGRPFALRVDEFEISGDSHDVTNRKLPIRTAAPYHSCGRPPGAVHSPKVP